MDQPCSQYYSSRCPANSHTSCESVKFTSASQAAGIWDRNAQNLSQLLAVCMDASETSTLAAPVSGPQQAMQNSTHLGHTTSISYFPECPVSELFESFLLFRRPSTTGNLTSQGLMRCSRAHIWCR